VMLGDSLTEVADWRAMLLISMLPTRHQR
jgi:hypothetical protein